LSLRKTPTIERRARIVEFDERIAFAGVVDGAGDVVWKNLVQPDQRKCSEAWRTLLARPA
jgi:hypothetical protein